ncbi:TPA: IS66 family transposase, partial [Escherichia coli]|nr:IS66 family transposase [Salmonella enterica]HDV5273127.1 IS66 family transposase [Escherichia coli]
MKTTPENLTPSPDLNGLCAAELLAVIAGFQQQLALKDEAIQRRDAHILLLEELLRLRRIQRFAASSEKLHQLQLFDEAELEAEIDSLLAQLPNDLPQTA